MKCCVESSEFVAWFRVQCLVLSSVYRLEAGSVFRAKFLVLVPSTALGRIHSEYTARFLVPSTVLVLLALFSEFRGLVFCF